MKCGAAVELADAFEEGGVAAGDQDIVLPGEHAAHNAFEVRRDLCRAPKSLPGNPWRSGR